LPPYPEAALSGILDAQRQAEDIYWLGKEEFTQWYSIIWNTLRYTTPAVRSALRVKFPFSGYYFKARPLAALFRAMQYINPPGLLRATRTLTCAGQERIAFIDTLSGSSVTWLDTEAVKQLDHTGILNNGKRVAPVIIL